jgi:CheY-like chemotaxis protein
MMTGTIFVPVRRTILIVDDDPGTRSGLKRYFERANYDVIAVGSFVDGRRALKELSPDLLISDVRLGEFNGLQLLATNPGTIPTIIVTGHPDPVLEADARRLGADYLLKPISPSVLLTMVERKLEPANEAALPFSPGRRSSRRPVIGELPIRIDGAPARVVDVSDGGLCFEIEPVAATALPNTFTISLPEISVRVDLIWKSRGDGDRWTCGAAIAAGQNDITQAWRGVVDAVAASA